MELIGNVCTQGPSAQFSAHVQGLNPNYAAGIWKNSVFPLVPSLEAYLGTMPGHQVSTLPNSSPTYVMNKMTELGL